MILKFLIRAFSFFKRIFFSLFKAILRNKQSYVYLYAVIASEILKLTKKTDNKLDDHIAKYFHENVAPSILSTISGLDPDEIIETIDKLNNAKGPFKLLEHLKLSRSGHLFGLNFGGLKTTYDMATETFEIGHKG